MLQTVRKLLSLSFAIFFVLFFAATVPDSLRASFSNCRPLIVEQWSGYRIQSKLNALEC